RRELRFGVQTARAANTRPSGRQAPTRARTRPGARPGPSARSPIGAGSTYQPFLNLPAARLCAGRGYDPWPRSNPGGALANQGLGLVLAVVFGSVGVGAVIAVGMSPHPSIAGPSAVVSRAALGTPAARSDSSPTAEPTAEPTSPPPTAPPTEPPRPT